LAKGLPAHADLTSADGDRLIETHRGQPDVATAVELAEQILTEHAANVVFSDKAREGAIGCPFLRPDEVFGALLRLGFYWNEVRSQGVGRIEDRAREKLRCSIAMHESESTTNRFGNERKVRHNNEECALQKHLTLGGGPQNVQTTAQIYFGDKDGQVLIGHIGRHLTVANTQ
jgi:hypothetical protein